MGEGVDPPTADELFEAAVPEADDPRPLPDLVAGLMQTQGVSAPEAERLLEERWTPGQAETVIRRHWTERSRWE
ncbi:hypothetical protein [Halomarina litorea]|uniref:hypothetical protein n=1 Tax=Halomarina litorea TaxID=2961595 RepID=UPI0020C55DEB|nr:hypothetical protein [Halomarina sp. BCD28]